MSTGTPSGAAHAECQEVLAKLAFFLDHELAEADSRQIRQHLEECRPCLDMLAMERTIKALVARSCCEAAPAELRQQVLVRIREVRLHIDT